MEETQPTMQDVLATIQDVLGALNAFSSQVDERFNVLEARLGTLDGVDQRLHRVEANMVTKSYLDEKLGVLRGDTVLLVRREDTKVVALVGALTKEQALSSQAAERILTMEPFPKITLDKFST